MSRFIFLLFAFDFFCATLFSQPSGTVSGTVIDAITKAPLPGATVVLKNSNPFIGTSTDWDGNFVFSKIPVGRASFVASYIGYDAFEMQDILVTSGKTVSLVFTLDEAVQSLDEVVVKPATQKERAINTMSLVSARQISVEEASRYAGGFDDPARLASASAGAAGGLGQNAISVRGNAPKNVLWRLEGIEIDNPSHFANVTSFGGGGITALSAQMLANSDFLTGAFPAEYGNVLGGVFDVHLRKGNARQKQFTVQAGGIGLDFSAEGPLPSKNDISYLFNYRYATLALFAPVLPEDAQGISYQDLSFNIAGKAGKETSFSFWGLGAADRSGVEPIEDVVSWVYQQDREKTDVNQGMGALGFTLRSIVSKNTVTEQRLAVSGSWLDYNEARIDSLLIVHPFERIQQDQVKVTWQNNWHIKVSPAYSLHAGWNINRRGADVLLRYAEKTADPLHVAADQNDAFWSNQVFVQNRYHISPNSVLAGGITVHHVSFSGEISVEPRISFQSNVRKKVVFSTGYGLHSQLEMPSIYSLQIESPQGIVRPNKNLRMAKAHHLVASLELREGPFRFRVEPYVQFLFDVPSARENSFSVINLDQDWFFQLPLMNDGKARNLGIDFTAERFLADGFYVLATGSIFSSRYKTPAIDWTSTRFDKGFVTNLLAGYEFPLRGKLNRTLSINGRMNLMGGNRFTPIDETASAANLAIVEDETRPFASKSPNVYFADATISLRTNRMGFSSLLSLQIINLFGFEEFYGHRINLKTQSVEMQRERLMIPNISWKVEF